MEAKGIAVETGETGLAEALRRADRDIIAESLTSEGPAGLIAGLCDRFGTRFGGSIGERQSAGWLAERFEEAGCRDVALESFTLVGWERGAASLTVSAPSSLEVDCISLPYVETSDVTAELCDVGYGTPGMFAARAGEIKGKVVLVDAKSPVYLSRGIHRGEKYRRAVAAGAVGFVWMRDQGGFLEETGGLRPGCAIPAVAVSNEDGQALRRLMRSGPVRVRLRAQGSTHPATSRNVTAVLGGGEGPPALVCGGHYDSHDIAPGAVDNATGVAVAVEAARLLAPYAELLPRPVAFALFGAEEIGLLGSRAYLSEHRADLDGLRFMLNLDAVGRPGTRGIALQDWPELIAVFEGFAAGMNWPLLVDVAFGMHSDMYPFSLAGVPSGNFNVLERVRTGRDWGHTRADTLDKVSPLELRIDAMLVARLLLRAAARPSWPAGRKTREEIDDAIRRAGLGEALDD